MKCLSAPTSVRTAGRRTSCTLILIDSLRLFGVRFAGMIFLLVCRLRVPVDSGRAMTDLVPEIHQRQGLFWDFDEETSDYSTIVVHISWRNAEALKEWLVHYSGGGSTIAYV